MREAKVAPPRPMVIVPADTDSNGFAPASPAAMKQHDPFVSAPGGQASADHQVPVGKICPRTSYAMLPACSVRRNWTLPKYGSGAPLSVPLHQQVRYEGQRRGRALGYCVLERRHADATIQRLFDELQPFVAYAAGRPSKRALNARDIGRDLY